jgi:hypothetical protein
MGFSSLERSASPAAKRLALKLRGNPIAPIRYNHRLLSALEVPNPRHAAALATGRLCNFGEWLTFYYFLTE